MRRLFVVGVLLVGCSRSGLPTESTTGSGTSAGGTTAGQTTGASGGTSSGNGTTSAGGSGGDNGGTTLEIDLAMPRDMGVRGAPLDLSLIDLAPAPTGPTQAPSFRIDPAHTAAQPREMLRPSPSPAWTYDAGGMVTYPLVADGRVFITTGGSFAADGLVTALDTQTGHVVWGPKSLGAGLLHAYDDGKLFVMTADGLVMALDAATGQQKWSAAMTGQFDFWSPPVAADGLVYINGMESGGTTYAVDESNGNVVWTEDTFDGSEGAVAYWWGMVYEAEACSQTTAWDGKSGAQAWHYSTDCTGGGGAAPVVYGGKLYVRDWAEGNTILDLNGHALGSFSASQPPAFSDGVGYFLQTNTLRAIDAGSSTVLWSFAGDGMLSTAPVVAGGYVYVGSSLGNLYQVDTGGQLVWSVMLPAPVNAAAETNSMAVAEGTLLVPAGNVLYAYR